MDHAGTQTTGTSHEASLRQIRFKPVELDGRAGPSVRKQWRADHAKTRCHRLTREETINGKAASPTAS